MSNVRQFPTAPDPNEKQHSRIQTEMNEVISASQIEKDLRSGWPTLVEDAEALWDRTPKENKQDRATLARLMVSAGTLQGLILKLGAIGPKVEATLAKLHNLAMSDGADCGDPMCETHGKIDNDPKKWN